MQPDLQDRWSRRVGSLLHITCLALANNLAILRQAYPDELVSVTLTDSVSLFSGDLVFFKNWAFRCRACYDRIITPSFSLD